MTESNKLKRQVLHSLKWVAMGRVTTQLVRWLMTFWVLRLLSPDDYGTVAMADVLSGFLMLLLGSMFVTAIIQSKEMPIEKLKPLFGAILISHFSIFALQYLTADWIGVYYGSQNVANVLKVSAFCFLILAFEIIPTALLTRDMRFKQVSIIAAIANISAAVSTLVMAFMGYGFWALVIGEIISISIRTVLTLVVNPIRFLPNFRFSEVTGFLKFGSMLTVHSMLFYVFLYMDVTVAGRVMSADEVGLFAVGLHFALMPQKKILPLLRQVAFPAFSKIQDQPERIKYYILKGQRISMLVTIPIFWGLASVVDLVIPLVLGEKWQLAVVPTTLMLLVMPLRFSQELFVPALKSQKKVVDMIINTLWMAGILLIGLLSFVHLGAVGLSLAWLVAFPIAYCIVIYRNSRILNFGFFVFLRSFMINALPGGIMLMAVFGSKYAIELNDNYALPLQVMLGAFSYLLATRLFNNKGLQEVLALKRS